MFCGHNYIGFTRSQKGSKKLRIFSTLQGSSLPEEFTVATEEEIEEAAAKATAAFAVYRKKTAEQKAIFLESIAAEILELGEVLNEKVGRILYNGVPTGVEVCYAMVHGGPYPATSDPRSTSVGADAIKRFVRPVCFQDCPDEFLPDALKNSNPLGIMRRVNGQFSKEFETVHQDTITKSTADRLIHS